MRMPQQTAHRTIADGCVPNIIQTRRTAFASRCIPPEMNRRRGEMLRRLVVVLVVLGVGRLGTSVDAATGGDGGVARRRPAWMQSGASPAHRLPHRFQQPGTEPPPSSAPSAVAVKTVGPAAAEAPQMDRVPDTIEVWPGQTAILSCVVRNQGDRVVSWIRTRDLQILTSGDIVFTSDSRFTMDISWTAAGDGGASGDGPQMWPLTIEKVRLEDDGLYECQLNTEPKLLGKVTLVVREPAMADPPFAAGAVSIDGARERSVKAGSNIRLVCRATATTVDEQLESDGGPLVMWYFAGQPIAADTSRGGVSINTEWTRHGAAVVSTLTVARSGPRDAGTYHCEVRTLGGADHVEVMVVGRAEAEGAASAGRRVAVIGQLAWTMVGVVVGAWRWMV